MEGNWRSIWKYDVVSIQLATSSQIYILIIFFFISFLYSITGRLMEIMSGFVKLLKIDFLVASELLVVERREVLLSTAWLGSAPGDLGPCTLQAQHCPLLPLVQGWCAQQSKNQFRPRLEVHAASGCGVCHVISPFSCYPS